MILFIMLLIVPNFLFFFNLFYFLAVLGLHCHTGFPLVAVSKGSSSCGVQASCCSSLSRALGHTGFSGHVCGLSSCDSWTLAQAQQLRLLDPRARAQQLQRSGLVALWPVGSSQTRDRIPALAGGFFTTEPPGEPLLLIVSILKIFSYVIAMFYSLLTLMIPFSLYIQWLKIFLELFICLLIMRILLKISLIYLAMLGVKCGMQGLWSLLHQVGSWVVACGIQFSDHGWNLVSPPAL